MAGADRDLGRGDFVSVDCPGCHYAPLRTPVASLKFGLNPAAKVQDIKGASDAAAARTT